MLRRKGRDKGSLSSERMVCEKNVLSGALRMEERAVCNVVSIFSVTVSPD
jgi:hypothetical protein